MRRAAHHLSRAITLLVVLLTAPAAWAQVQISTSGEAPTWEFAVQGGAWNLMRSSFAGARLTRNFNDWLAVDVIADARRLPSDTDPAYRLGGVNLKFTIPGPRRPGTAHWLFLTAGGVATSGLGIGVSPMVGVGGQTRWHGPVAIRLELQRLVRGHTVHNGGRFLAGVALGLGR